MPSALCTYVFSFIYIDYKLSLAILGFHFDGVVELQYLLTHHIHGEVVCTIYQALSDANVGVVAE